MNVEELFRRLAFGELSNLSMADPAAGTIRSDKQGSLITHANEALTKLYTRFVLSEKEVIFRQLLGCTHYHFSTRFAVSNNERLENDPIYIMDHGCPFQNDVIRVLHVHNDCGQELALNDPNNCMSVFTPNHTYLQVPNPIPGQLLSVVYQAQHPNLPYGVLGTEIALPLALEPALTNFIAYKIFSAMSGQESSIKAQEHLAIYEGTCAEMEMTDSAGISRSSSHSKLERRGFV